MTAIKNGTPVVVMRRDASFTGVVCDYYCTNPDGRPMVHPWYDVIVDYFENIVFVHAEFVKPLLKKDQP